MFGNRTGVTIRSEARNKSSNALLTESDAQNLVSYGYKANNGLLEFMAYGATSDSSEETARATALAFLDYVYDPLERLSEVTYSDIESSQSVTYGYNYSSDGALSGITVNSTLGYTYEYDAWGREVAQTASGNNGQNLYNYNCLKYRGYYFDSDLGLYYLNSRFYDPNVGRFLNPDTENVLDMNHQNFVQYNLYAYCWNNPINLADDMGDWPSWIKKAVTVVAVAATVVVATVVTVSTCGAGSIAGIAMLSTTLTMAAKTTEVTALQIKKGMEEGKSAREISKNVMESLYDNGGRIVGLTPILKTPGIAFNHYLYSGIERAFGGKQTLKNTLKSGGGKGVYLGTVYAWGQTLYTILKRNPVEAAKERGYTLK